MKKGFAALIIVMVVSFTLLAAVLSASLGLFTLREHNLEARDKLQSEASAESCLDYAYLRLVQDPSFRVARPKILSLPQGFCIIENITVENAYFTITASAEVGNTRTFFTATLDLSDNKNPHVIEFRQSS